VGAENRVTSCDLGVLVVEVDEPVRAAERAMPCLRRHAGTSEVYGRYIGGSAARTISPLPHYRIPAGTVEITDRVHPPMRVPDPTLRLAEIHVRREALAIRVEVKDLPPLALSQQGGEAGAA
jgi:hypothetical protein